MGYEEDSNRGGKNESLPSYKLPGVYPSGSQETLGLDNTNLLQGSLGNWNNIVKDSGPDGNPRSFVSFASNAEITIPTISGEGIEGRPAFIKIFEDVIFDNGFIQVGVEGISRDEWYQEGDSGFNNLMRYKSKRGVIKERTSGFSRFKPYSNMNMNNSNLAIFPSDVLDKFIIGPYFNAQGSDRDGVEIFADEWLYVHEKINTWILVVRHYYDVTLEEVHDYLDYIEDNADSIYPDSSNPDYTFLLDRWETTFGGKFKYELFENATGYDSKIFYVDQNDGKVERENEQDPSPDAILPDNWRMDFEDEEGNLLWERSNDEKITAQIPIGILNNDDAYFFSNGFFHSYQTVHAVGMTVNYTAYKSEYDSFLLGELTKQPDFSSETTEVLFFPRTLSLFIPSEIENLGSNVFPFNVSRFPVQSEINPRFNFVGTFADIVKNKWINPDNTGPNINKFGYPYFSYDYIFSNEEDVNIDEQPASKTIVDYQVDCTVSNSDTHLIYYEIGSEEYRKTSYPIEVDLNLKLVDDVNVTYQDPIGGGFNLQSSFALLDMLYGNKNHVDFVLNEVINPPFHFRYDVIQWGDEDVLLTDEQIEASFYFNMYDLESYPPDTNSYEYKKFVHSHIKSKPANSISKHVYNSPGVKRLKIIAYKMSSNGVFVLQTYLIQKNIVVSDGNLSAQDFAVFGLGNYKYLPIKENQALIGGLSSDSDYNQSVAKILKDDDFTEEDYLERVSSVRYLEKFNQGLLGESSVDTISSDIGQVRMFNTPKDIYSFIGGNRLEIINNGFGTLPANSFATDIFIKDDNCIVEFNPSDNELFTIQNKSGGNGQGVIIGDYKLVQPKTSRIRREGDMNRPEIITEKDRQAF